MKSALASFICSLVSLFIFWWLGIIGVILGATSICRYEGDLNERSTVVGFSVAGIVIGAVSIILYLFLFSVITGAAGV